MPTNNNDIISEINGSDQSNSKTFSNFEVKELYILESIDKTVKDILKSSGQSSQSNAFNALSGSRSFRDKSKSNISAGKGFSRGATNDFADAFKKSIFEALIGSDFKEQIQSVFSDLADGLGVEIGDIPKTLGAELGKTVMSAFKGSAIGKELTGKLDDAKSKFVSNLRSTILGTSQQSANAKNEKSKGSQSQQADGDSIFRKSTKSNVVSDIQNIVIHAQSVTVQQSDISNLASGISEEPAEQIKNIISSNLGGDALAKFKEADLGTIKDFISKGDKSSIANMFTSAFGESGEVSSTIQALTGMMSTSGAELVGSSELAIGAIGGLTGAAVVAGAAMVAVTAAMWALSPAIEATTKLIKKASETADRYATSRQNQIKTETDRLKADVETMVKAPFDILKQAAEEMYNVWDTNLRKINGTQGYSKDDLQDLIASFADRLRSEGLTKVVSASSITDNLAKVLDSGLSGKVAEEFAYIATKLNAAIPTQDFFSYASTYSSIAANAIRQGKSQSEAIDEANRQLEGFANNILYASREIAGGFTTGLKDAENLFTESVQIAQASKTGNATQISAVMTAVSAITGAIAPDLAQSMTDAIYKAATGGNSTEIVALRSLAGINASNTEFLKQLAQDPQKVFANLFSELGKRQNMSEDAYMEVAEGLSNIFGVSSDAFARVDFSYLAQAISSMDTNSTALLDNMDLLASGQTTTNAEQLKMQQINEYMLDEGLSYVLDNAAARSIQEHMWDEQIANDLMEATYGVELQGSALEFLEGIRHTVENIMILVNPAAMFGKIKAGITNLIGSAVESSAQRADVKQLLELGKVGNGNATAAYQLTTTGQNLNVTDDIISLMGGISAYSTTSKIRQSLVNTYTPWNSFYDAASSRGFTNRMNQAYATLSSIGSIFNSSPSSNYHWGTVGKSSSGISSAITGSDVLGVSALKSRESQSSNPTRVTNNAVQKFLGTMSSYLEENSGKDVSYENWAKTATRFGISNLSDALTDVGLTNEAVQGQFEAFQAEEGIRIKQEREQREDQFWVDNITQLSTSNSWMETIYKKQSDFYDDFILFHEDFLAYGGKAGRFEAYQKAFNAYCTSWTEYYVKHTAYRNAVGYDSSSWDKVRSAENSKSRDAVYALAAALTKNSVELLDPAVQTNVLLAEILQIVNAILQTEFSNSDSSALPNSLSALALGINNLK